MIDINVIAETIKKQIKALQSEAENNTVYYKGAIDGIQKLMDELAAEVKKVQDAEATAPKEQSAGE